MNLVINETKQIVRCQEPNQVAVVTETETKVLKNKEVVFMEGENLGAGAEVFKERAGAFLRYRTLVAGDNVTIAEDANTITINSEASGVSNISGFTYVAKNADVTGTRDGSFERPFATIQEAIDLYGVPTTQAEYLLLKNIEVLDTATYTENLTFPTGRWVLNFSKAFIVGNITWEVTNTERFGSTQQPTLVLQKDVNDIVTAVTGNISVIRKTGGTVISLGTVRLAGFNIQNGTVTIADGTNGGLTAFTTAVLSQIGVGYAGTSTILARTAFVSFIDSGFNPSLAMEIGAITIIRDTTINSQDISEYLNSTTIRQIRALQLNNSGNVTFRAIGSARNWNVDTVSGSEILTKITSFPNNALNLTKPVASAIRIQDTGNYFTATDVEGALQELAAFVGL